MMMHFLSHVFVLPCTRLVVSDFIVVIFIIQCLSIFILLFVHMHTIGHLNHRAKSPCFIDGYYESSLKQINHKNQKISISPQCKVFNVDSNWMRWELLVSGELSTWFIRPFLDSNYYNILKNRFGTGNHETILVGPSEERQPKDSNSPSIKMHRRSINNHKQASITSNI